MENNKCLELLNLYRKLADGYGEYLSTFDSEGNRVQEILTKTILILREIEKLEGE